MAIGLALVIVGVVVLIAIYGATSADPQSGSGFAVIGGAVGGILVLASWAIGPLRHRASLGSLGLKLPASRGSFQFLLPLLVFVASLVFAGIYTILVSLLGWDTPDSPLEEIGLGGPAVIWSLAFVVVLWGPLAEEVFFRGFIFSGLRRRMGFAGAAVVSSIIFALFHVDPRVMVPIFVTGMLLAWLYHRTGSVWSSFAAHAMQNALAFSIATWV